MAKASSNPSDFKRIWLPRVSAPCRGDSMRGTLAEGDGLLVSPVSFDFLKTGDVVAFEAGGKVVAHRIVGRDQTGFLTQGDGNWSRDSAPLVAGQLIGKVVEREHLGVRNAVVGGTPGRWRGMFLRTLSRMRMRAEYWRAAPCRLKCVSRLVSRVWRPGITVVRFVSPAGATTKFVHRGKTVACWKPQFRRWECRSPYDLILFPPSR